MATLKIATGPDGDPVWALEEGGDRIAEQMLLARWFISLHVYYHKTRFVLDHHLRGFVREWLGGEGTFPMDLSDYLACTDAEVLSAATKGDSPAARGLLRREHLRLCKEFGRSDFSTREEFNRFATRVRDGAGFEVYADDFVLELRKEGDGELWVETREGLKPLSDVSRIVQALAPEWVGRIYAPKERLAEARDMIDRMRRDA